MALKSDKPTEAYRDAVSERLSAEQTPKIDELSQAEQDWLRRT